MRIAIPVLDGQIAPHIGHSKTFLIAEVADGKVVSTTELPNPGHGPGGPPPIFIANQEVDQVLAWGAPEHVREILGRKGVAITLGCKGEPLQVLEAYLNGTLELTDEGLDGGPCNCHH